MVLKNGRFGPYLEVKIGKEFKRVSIPKQLPITEINNTHALALLNVPRTLGKIDDQDVVLARGRMGAFLSKNEKTYSVSNLVKKIQKFWWLLELQDVEEYIKSIDQKNHL